MEDIQILEQALNIACQRGCFTLGDSAAILQSLNNLKNEFTNKNGADSVHVQPTEDK